MIVARPAGFWIRVVAALLDFVLFALVQWSLGAAARRAWHLAGDDATMGVKGMAAACTVVFAALYTITLHALDGQTIGKLVMRIRVVGLDGAPPTVGTAVLRFLAYAASLLPFGLGFVMAGLRADRRALHDLLAGTRVEHLPRAVSMPAAAAPPEAVAPPPA